MKRKAKDGEPHAPYAPGEYVPSPSEVLPAEVTESVVEDLQSAMTSNETDPAPDEDPAEPVRHPVVETILVQYDFSETEIVRMAKALTQQRAMYQRTENELGSIKKDYSSRLEKIEVETSRLADLISDGFEMRQVPAVVMVAIDKQARTAHRCYYRRDNGAFIKRELITGTHEMDMFTLLPDGHSYEDALPAEILENCL